MGTRKYRPLQLRHELTGATGKPKAGEGLTLTHQGRNARSRVLPTPQGAPHLQEPRPAVAGIPLCFSNPAFFSLLPPGSRPPLTFCQLSWSLPSAPPTPSSQGPLPSTPSLLALGGLEEDGPSKTAALRTSLVAWWLRTHFPMQGM